jgi:methyl-accepting chemotaxis protein
MYSNLENYSDISNDNEVKVKLSFKTIKGKLQALFLTVISISVSLSVIITLQFVNYIAKSEKILKTASQIELQAAQIQVLFLKQNSEWKNILLRGTNEELYQQHVKNFKDLAVEIEQNTSVLHELVADFPSLESLVEFYAAAQIEMNNRYLEALPVFKLAEHKPHITADKYVRGINLKANELIKSIIQSSAGLKSQSTAQMSKSLLTAKIITWGVGVFLILFLVVIFFYTIHRGIILPLQTATDVMKNIAEGDRDLTLRMNDKGGDEISVLGGWYNKFLENVHSLMEQIATTANHLASASNNTARITNTTTQTIRVQQGAIESVATSMGEMAETVHTIASKAAQAADSAVLANNEAETGQRDVRQTSQSIKVLSEEISAAEKVIESLAGRSKDIGSIIGAINEISDQTNLLALNAAIEAARAGEYGRGFAVVADEVRTLAANTQAATQEIQGMINSIQQETHSAVEVMSRSRKQASETVSYSEQAAEALVRIMSAVTEIQHMNQDIAHASEQQSHVASEINHNVRGINQSVEETLENAKRSTSDNGDLAQLSLLLHSLISQFRLAEGVVSEWDMSPETVTASTSDEVELF